MQPSSGKHIFKCASLASRSVKQSDRQLDGIAVILAYECSLI